MMTTSTDLQDERVVLVVDDDPTIRMLASETLEQAGFTVRTASDGEEAMKIFDDILPQVILLDVMMPGIDGFSVCRQIRSHPEGRHATVLMMTGLDDVRSIEQAYEIGATDFITKPINWMILGYRVSYMYRANLAFRELNTSRAQLIAAHRIARLGSWEWDTSSGRFFFSNELFHILGLDPEVSAGTYESFIGVIHPLDKEHVRATIEEAVKSHSPFRVDYKIVMPDTTERFVNAEGHPEPNRRGLLGRITGTVQDITERKQAEAQIHSLALYDALTGLPNRVLFRDRLEQAIRLAARQKSMIVVMFIDLDLFKDINDSMGHVSGDALLREVGQRLRSVMRASDTAARLGGDEFTVCIQNVPSVDIVCSLVQKIMDIFTEPFCIESREIYITASIGAAVYPGDADKADDLLKHADTAMYSVKEQGKGNFKLFSPEMQIKADTRLAVQNELRLAVERNEFVLYYQPKFDTVSCSITGVEALVRWQHPQKGLVFPNAFIPVAEANGLIVPLGEWVINEACRQNMRWQTMGYSPVQVAVNVSAVQFQRCDIVATIRLALETTGMDPGLLQIELTETSLMHLHRITDELKTQKSASSVEGGGPIFNALDTLHKMGVSIALDDFGTGYSSLSYLRYFPLDRIKIDRSFVWAINARQGSDIISIIIEMAKKLRLKVTAEGVETEYQKTYLLELGCDELQGYLMGKPVPADACMTFFSRAGD